MKIRQIIYAVAGILEWNTTLKVGGTRLRIQFSGGRLEGTGNMPATYSTKNPVIQKLIERSEEFKSGKIFRYFESRAEEELETESDRMAARSGKKVAEAPAAAEAPAEAIEAGEAEAADSGEVIEVGCSDDARVYLKEHFGVAGSRLPNRAAIEEAARSHGIEFRFQK